MEASDELQQQLRHVFWIGGSTCAGKSTTAATLGERYGLRVYHFDRREPFHIYRSIPEEQPNLIRFMGRTMDEKWVSRSAQEMTQEVLACWTERFPMVVDDLLHLSGDGPIIAEGAGFFPALVAPLLAALRPAAWLAATPAFIAQVRGGRGKSVADADHISDRERAFRNLIERDRLIAAEVRQQAEARGLDVIEVDSESVAQLPDRLNDMLTAWLPTVT